MGLIGRTLINAVAIVVAALLIPGITFGQASYGFGDLDRWISLVLTAFVLGIVNAFVRPIVQMISLPLTCLTLGIFYFVINGLMLLLVSAIPLLGFGVDGLLTAIIGAIVIGIVGFVVSHLIPH
ncbi:MAG TPA: phage holin family protein [Candidatus Limnocylindria bacterium]